MTEHDFAFPQPAHQRDEVLDLRGRDPRDAVRVEEGSDAAAEAQREATVGEAVHRRRVGRGDDRVPGVVVRCRGRDPEGRRHRAHGAGERERFFDVEAFGDERGAEAERLTGRDFADQLGGRLRCAREHVEAELVQLVHAPILTRPIRARRNTGGRRRSPLRRLRSRVCGHGPR